MEENKTECSEKETADAGGGAGTKLSLEDAFDQLEKVALKLEDKDTPLEEAFSFYKEGMELVKYCSAKLDQVEKKMLELGEDGSLHEFRG